MATRRRSSSVATKAPAKTATTVKTVKKSTPTTVKKATGAIYTRNSQDRTVMTKTETIETPTTRPASPKLTLQDYKDDFQARVKIHNWEVNELWTDCKAAYSFATPYVKQAVDFSVKTYNQVVEVVERVGVAQTN